MDYRLEPPAYEEEGFPDWYKEMRGYYWDEEFQDFLDEDLRSWSDAEEYDCIASGCYL